MDMKSIGRTLLMIGAFAAGVFVGRSQSNRETNVWRDLYRSECLIHKSDELLRALSEPGCQMDGNGGGLSYAGWKEMYQTLQCECGRRGLHFAG